MSADVTDGVNECVDMREARLDEGVKEGKVSLLTAKCRPVGNILESF